MFAQIFIKVPNIKFYGNPSSGSLAYACDRTDGRDVGNKALFVTTRTS